MTRVLLVLQVVALAVGLTACGGDALSLDPVASAATRTVEAGSSRVEFNVAMKVGGDSVDMTGSGAFDYSNARGTATYRMRGGALTAPRGRARAGSPLLRGVCFRPFCCTPCVGFCS